MYWPPWQKGTNTLGTYNPDWAVVVEQDGAKKLYFVVETKGTNLFNEVPEEQTAKIHCGRMHFHALGADAEGGDFAYVGPVKDFPAFASKTREK